MRLCKISENDIMETIESPDLTQREGNKLIALKEFSNRFSGYPLKIVYERTGDEMRVITAYPLKRRYRR
jgi:hypothetical protein